MPVVTREFTCDILVAGGGAAGVPCALAAARSGSRVILCQDRPVLGGNASSEVRMHIVGANGIGASERGLELATEARESGIIEEIRLENAVHNPQRSASVFDLILYDICRREPNLELLLNTTVTAADVTGNRIQSIRAERQSTEEVFRISASIFVDCTGDGRLGVEAGATYREGREGTKEFNESLAPEKADAHRLGSTILLQARKHPSPMPFAAPAWVRAFSREDLKLRLYATPGDEEPTHEYGYWWAEWGGTLDTIRDNERIRDELLAIALGIWDHIKNGPAASQFQADHWALDWIGFLPGKRESRRFVGLHILSEEDILSSREFIDAIAYGGWSLDLHPPEGVDAPEKEPCVQHPVPHLYDIPLRSCISQNVSNLMFAGRNISATHVAFSSTRVMATCAVTGQGVGTAAAVAAQQGILPGVLFNHRDTIEAIQSRLLSDDCFLIDRNVLSPGSPIARAEITASSEQPGSPAENVRSTQTRCTHGEKGAPVHRRVEGSHRWMSDSREGFPCWIQFTWNEPLEVREIRLIFDTGLHRHLTLSHHDGYTSKMIWGQPQPETVRDFDILIEVENEWTTALEIRGNYQRFWRKTFDRTMTISRLKISIISTNGIDHARILAVDMS